MRTTLNPFSNENTRKIFKTAQNNINLLFQHDGRLKPVEESPEQIEAQPINSLSQNESTDLKNHINEFYQVQRNFHESMAKFANALSLDMPLSETKKVNCQELIRPYLVLANNPFKDSPTGNNQEDIKHILDVVTAQNQNFEIALRALALSISKAEVTQEILQEIKENPASLEAMKDTLGCKSWMLVEGYIGKPMQNLTRIELLLKEIQKSLNKDSSDLSNMVQQLQAVLGKLCDQIQSINDNMDDLILLNRVERILQAIYELKEVDGLSLSLAIFSEEGNDKKYDIKLKDFISSTIDTIRQGLRNILLDTQDITLLYKELLTFLIDIADVLKKQNVVNKNSSHFFSYVSSYFYTPKQEDKPHPVAELTMMISQLNELVERLDIINNIPFIQEKAQHDFKVS